MLAVYVVVPVVIAVWVIRSLVPRFAHRAFAGGDFALARRRYRVIAWTAITGRRRAAARVSIAGTWLAQGDYAAGQQVLGAIDGERLDAPTRAGWLNNRAYAALRLGARGDAARPALAWVREAIAIRADVPGLLHTEGMALLAVGQPDAAVRVFEAMWEQGEPAPRLEAERCHDLARAWTELGHADYAEDYRRRARRAAPDAPWLAATEHETATPMPEGLLDDVGT